MRDDPFHWGSAWLSKGRYKLACMTALLAEITQVSHIWWNSRQGRSHLKNLWLGDVHEKLMTAAMGPWLGFFLDIKSVYNDRKQQKWKKWLRPGPWLACY